MLVNNAKEHIEMVNRIKRGKPAFPEKPKITKKVEVKMGQYNNQVEQQRLKLEAEEWSKGIVSIHFHRIKSMWYDERPQDTDLGYVNDIQYNSGLIQRTLNNGDVVFFGEEAKGEDLIAKYRRNTA